MKVNIIYIIDYCFKLRAVSDCIINFLFFFRSDTIVSLYEFWITDSSW